MRRSVLLLPGCMLVAACADPPSSKSAAPPPVAAPVPAVPSQSPASGLPVPARDSSGVPKDFQALWKTAASGGTAGQYGTLTYQYATSGDRAAAVLIPKPIPRDDTILVGAIADFVTRTFRADLAGASPRLADTHYGRAIAFDVPRYTYYVLTIKNETREGNYGPGEPHTLLVWRERP